MCHRSIFYKLRGCIALYSWLLKNSSLQMDDGEKLQDGENISPIMKLPEEAMREVFNNMSFQTLYFSLRRVCKDIQSYVDNYLKVRGGTSFFVGCRNGSEKEVIEITEKPKKGFIILRTPATSIPWVTFLYFEIRRF